MNWLAHLYLSEPEPHARIGNLLPDVLRQGELAEVPAVFQAGIARHVAVDRFTDAHPVWRRSVRRFHGPLRRYAPVLVDVFYDHFLSRAWDRHAVTGLEELVAEFGAAVEREGRLLPPRALERLRQIRDGGWLLSYGDPAGVADALRRTGRRLRKPVPLEEAVAVLVAEEEGFRGDFEEFFPELRAHVAGGCGLSPRCFR